MLFTMLSRLMSSSDKRLVFVEILAYIPALIFALVIHELAHGLVAYWNGDDTAKLNRRLTLNPAKHFDPIGFLMLALVGFGWAKPVPINPTRFRNYRKGMITVSLAGVLANLAMAFLGTGAFALFAVIIKGTDVLLQGATAGYYLYAFFSYLLQYFIIINLTLMAFNLIPVFPLDGFRVVETLAKPNNRYVDFNYRYGSFLLLGILLASTALGRISPYLDVLGLYIQAVSNMLQSIFNAIFGL